MTSLPSLLALSTRSAGFARALVGCTSRLSRSCSPLVAAGSFRLAYPRRIGAPAECSHRPSNPWKTLAGEGATPRRPYFCRLQPSAALRPRLRP